MCSITICIPLPPRWIPCTPPNATAGPVPGWPPPCTATWPRAGIARKPSQSTTHAGAAARRTGDHAAEATTLDHIAGVYWQQSRYQQADDHLQQALALFRQTGDRVREAGTLSKLGIIRAAQGRYQEAGTLNAQGLDV